MKVLMLDVVHKSGKKKKPTQQIKFLHSFQRRSYRGLIAQKFICCMTKVLGAFRGVQGRSMAFNDVRLSGVLVVVDWAHSCPDLIPHLLVGL